MAFGIPRVPHGHSPACAAGWAAKRVQAAVAAMQQCAFDSDTRESPARPVQGIAFANAAEVDLHSLTPKSNGSQVGVQLDVPHACFGECLLYLGLRRHPMAPRKESPGLDERSSRNIKCAFCFFAQPTALIQQTKELIANRNRMLECQPVDPTALARVSIN